MCIGIGVKDEWVDVKSTDDTADDLNKEEKHRRSAKEIPQGTQPLRGGFIELFTEWVAGFDQV